MKLMSLRDFLSAHPGETFKHPTGQLFDTQGLMNRYSAYLSRIERDDADRRYRVALAELRAYGAER